MNDDEVKQGALKGSKELALHYMATLVEVARESFLILDSDLRVVSANPTFYQNFQVTPEQTENILLYDLGNGQWNIPQLKSLLEEILPQQKVVKDYEVKHTFQTIGEKTILLNARQIDIDTVQMIVLAMEDISARKELEERLVVTAQEKEDVRSKLAITAKELAVYTTGLEVKATERTKELVESKRASQYARSLIEASLDPFVTISADGKITDVNEPTVNVTGVPKEKLVGTDFSDYFTEPDKAREAYQQVFDKGSVTNYPLTIRHADGKKLTDVLYNASGYKDENGTVIGVFAAARDVTATKRAEEQLNARALELEKLNKAMVGRELRMIELKKELETLRGGTEKVA